MAVFIEHLLIWTGVLEIFTVGGIFFGWPAFVFILKEESIFYDLCNNTEVMALIKTFNDTDVVPHCDAQDAHFNLLFIIGCSMSMICMILFGYVLDKYGLLACRILAGVPLTIGLFLINFYGNALALTIGLEMLAFSAGGTLVTNLTLQPLWPGRSSTIGSIFSGTFDGSASTFMISKVLYENFGFSLGTITAMLLSFTLIHWLRTIFLMPMERCPTDKPLGYNVLDHTLFSYYCRNGNDESKEMAQKTAEEPGFKIPYDEPDVVQDAVKSTRSLKDENISLLEIAKELGKEIFTIRMAGLALWYAVVSLRINSFQAWFNPSLQWMFPGEKSTQSELTNIFGLTYIMSLPISPTAGSIVDYFAKRYYKLEKDEMKGRAVGIAVVCGICSIFSAMLSFLCTYQHNFAAAVASQVTFSIIRTFMYAIIAQGAMVLAPEHLFGLLFGFLNIAGGCTTIFAAPLFTLIQNQLDGDYTMVHYVLIVTCFSSVLFSLILVKYRPKV